MTFALAIVTILVAVLAFVLGVIVGFSWFNHHSDIANAWHWGEADAKAGRDRATLEKGVMQSPYDTAYDKYATRH